MSHCVSLLHVGSLCLFEGQLGDLNLPLSPFLLSSDSTFLMSSVSVMDSFPVTRTTLIFLTNHLHFQKSHLYNQIRLNHSPPSWMQRHHFLHESEVTRVRLKNIMAESSSTASISSEFWHRNLVDVPLFTNAWNGLVSSSPTDFRMVNSHIHQ